MFGIADNKEFLEAIGIANAPEDEKQKLIAGLEDLAQQKLTIAISDRITDEQANEFEAITDEQQAAEWVKQNIPDFENIVTSVLDDMKTDILAHKMKVVG